MLLEVKNLRVTGCIPLLPSRSQLVAKAARDAAANRDMAIVPVLVCRKAHATTFGMAKPAGIHHNVSAFCRRSMRTMEMRNELHFHDLPRGGGPSLRGHARLSRACCRAA